MYSLSEAIKNLKINKGNTILTIFTIMAAMVLMQLFHLINVNLQHAAEDMNKNIEVEIFLKDSMKPFEEEALINVLETSEIIKKYSFFSKEEAGKFFLENNLNMEGVLSSFEVNPLPNSYEIEIKKGTTIRKVEDFVREVKENNAIDSITYSGEWVKKFNAVLTVIKTIFTVFNGCLIFGAIFIISNTIKLSLFTREKEIEIMLLVGASYSFIKWPYLLEGCIQGVIGTFLASLGLFALFQIVTYQVSDLIAEFTGGYDLVFFNPGEALLVLFAGGLLGFIGSYFAVKKVVK